ncbi:MAG TPA: DUF5134 domain-containing protein [Sporichthya sp.]|nr:DUF5134 domain-containing protein [Sporichthya sp.]
MHHHAGGAAGGPYLNLLPLWLQVVWVLALAAVTASHFLTAGFARGEARVWTGAHALMGLGMLYMFLPWARSPLPAGALVALFGAAAGIGLLALAGDWNDGRPVRLMWLLVTVDMAAMAYMFQLVDSGAWLLTYGLVVWYCASAIGWSYGVADASLTRCCAVPFGGAVAIPPLRWARAGQAVMAVAMGWMLLAMDPHAGSFFGNAVSGGITADTYWLFAFVGLVVRVAADAGLVRRLAAPFWAESDVGAPRPVPRRPGALDGTGDIDAAGFLNPRGSQLPGHVAQDVAGDFFVHAGEGAQQVRP